MPWPANTSGTPTGVQANPVPGTAGASWTLTAQAVITLATGQTLTLGHNAPAPAALATALQTFFNNAGTAEGITVNWP